DLEISFRLRPARDGAEALLSLRDRRGARDISAEDERGDAHRHRQRPPVRRLDALANRLFTSLNQAVRPEPPADKDRQEEQGNAGQQTRRGRLASARLTHRKSLRSKIRTAPARRNTVHPRACSMAQPM